MGGSRGYRFLLDQVHPGVVLAGCCNGNGVSRLSMLGGLAARLAMGEQDKLLTVALAMEKPGLLPPDPLLRIGAGWRFARDRARGSAEL